MKKTVFGLCCLAIALSACTMRDELSYMDDRISSIEDETARLVEREVSAQIQETNRQIALVRDANDSLKVFVSVVKGGLDGLMEKESEDYRMLNANLDAVDSKTETLSGLIEELQDYVNEKSEEIQKWADSITITLEKLYELKSELALIQTDLTEIRSDISFLNSRCDALQGGINQANSDIETLGGQLSALAQKEGQDIQEINTAVSNLSGVVTSNYTELKGAVDGINLQIAQLFTSIGNETSAREAAVAEINGKIGTLNQSIGTLNSALDALTERVGANESSISDLTALTNTMHSTLEDCCTNITNLTTRMNGVEGRMGTAEEDIDGLQENYGVLQTTVDDIVASVQSMTIVPEYSDGSVQVVNGSNVLNFDIRPTSAARNLASVGVTVFSMTGYQAKTKASLGNSYDFSIDDVRFNESTNLVEVTVNTSNLTNNFFLGEEGATAVLAIKSGINDRTSEYFPLYAFVKMQSVSLVQAKEVAVGGIYQFVPEIVPPKSSNRNVTWTIVDADPAVHVATITSNGLLQALAEGKATVTVTAEDGGLSSSCTVTVKSGTVAVSGIVLNKTQIDATLGGTTTHVITATVLPSNATDKTVLWSSDNDAVASVSNGVVTVNGAGTAIITATSGFDPTIFASCVVNVTVPVTGVQFDAQDVTLSVDQSQLLSYTVLPANATNKDVIFSTVSGASCITLNPATGEVKATDVGTAVVKVTTVDGGKTATCTINCVVEPKSVTITPSADQTIRTKNGTVPFSATVSPEQAPQDITWSSSDPSVATVSASGLVTAVANGTTTITATAVNGVKKTVSVTVALATGIELKLSNGMSAIAYITGTEYPFDPVSLKATVAPEGASQEVTFSSSNSAVAAIDANSGAITVKSAGSVTFTATAKDGTGVSASWTVPSYHLQKKLVWGDIQSCSSNYPQPNPYAGGTGYCGSGSTIYLDYGYGEPNWCWPYNTTKSIANKKAAADNRYNKLYQYSYMMDGNSNTCYCTSFDIWGNDYSWVMANVKQTSPHYIQLNFRSSYKAISIRIMNPSQSFCRLSNGFGANVKINGDAYGIWYPTHGQADWNTYQPFLISKGVDITSLRIQALEAVGSTTDELGFQNNDKSGGKQTYGCFGIAEIEIYVAE